MADVAVILAAGTGSRMRGFVKDKMLAPLGGRPVILHALVAFHAVPHIDSIVISFRDQDQREQLVSAIATDPILAARHIQWVRGGDTRAASVLAALETAAERDGMDDLVFIHDGARPLIRSSEIERLASTARRLGAAALARPVTDTIVHAQGNQSQHSNGSKTNLKHLDRSALWAMETPQVFRIGQILQAYRTAMTANLCPTDDTFAVSQMGHNVAIVPADFPNPKLTTPFDFAWAEFLLKDSVCEKRINL